MKKTINIIMFFIFTIFFMTINSYAVTDEETISREETNIEEVSLEDNIIYKYDKKTNTTTVVTFDEVLSVCDNSSVQETKSYIPKEQSYFYDYGISMAANTNFFFSPYLSQTPYSDTCKIIAEGGLVKGSGFLVGSNLLLTCAHCVFEDKTFENYYSNWTCYPAYDNGIYKEGLSAGWDTVYYSSLYGSSTESTSNENDWAICVLQSDLGNSQGWFGCRSYGSSSSLEGMSVKSTGYPDNENFSGKYQYYTLGTISNVHTKWFDTDSLNYAGMSGGPIMQTSDNIAVGLTKGRYDADNSTYAVRITSNIINIINELQE